MQSGKVVAPKSGLDAAQCHPSAFGQTPQLR